MASKPKGKTHLVVPDTQIHPGADFRFVEWIGEYIADREPD